MILKKNLLKVVMKLRNVNTMMMLIGSVSAALISTKLVDNVLLKPLLKEKKRVKTLKAN